MNSHSFIVLNNRIIVNLSSGEMNLSKWASDAGYSDKIVSAAICGHTFEDGICLYKASNPEEAVTLNELMISSLATWFSGHYNYRPERIYIGKTKYGYPLSVVPVSELSLGIPTDVALCNVSA